MVLLGVAVGCATSQPTVAPSGPEVVSQDSQSGHAAVPALDSLDREFFVTCGTESVALSASGGPDPLPLGFIERPAQVRAGARRGPCARS